MSLRQKLVNTTNKQTDEQRDKETERQRDCVADGGQTDRQIDKQDISVGYSPAS